MMPSKGLMAAVIVGMVLCGHQLGTESPWQDTGEPTDVKS